jgi:hypothetical protein
VLEKISGYTGFKTEGQIILLDCVNNQGVNLVVRVDYMPNPVGSLSYGLWNTAPPFWKCTAKVSAGHMISSSSLFELIINAGDGIDKLLDWQEDFIIERVEPSFAEGQICNGYTRRLHLEKSGDEWKIDILHVSDGA